MNPIGATASKCKEFCETPNDNKDQLSRVGFDAFLTGGGNTDDGGMRSSSGPAEKNLTDKDHSEDPSANGVLIPICLCPNPPQTNNPIPLQGWDGFRYLNCSTGNQSGGLTGVDDGILSTGTQTGKSSNLLTKALPVFAPSPSLAAKSQASVGNSTDVPSASLQNDSVLTRTESVSAKIAEQSHPSREPSEQTGSGIEAVTGNYPKAEAVHKPDGMPVAMQQPSMRGLTVQLHHSQPLPAAMGGVVDSGNSEPGTQSALEVMDGSLTFENSKDRNSGEHGQLFKEASITSFPANPEVGHEELNSTQGSKPEQSERVTSVFQGVIEAADHMRSDGRGHVEFQVRLQDGANVMVHLQFQDGKIHPVFQSDSAEIRYALEQNWNSFANSQESREVHFGAPVFTDTQSSLGDSGGFDGRQSWAHYEPEQSNVSQTIQKQKCASSVPKEEEAPGASSDELRIFA